MSTTTETKRVTVNCPACQTVNVDADVNTRCSNCGEPVGVAVFQHSVDEIKKLTERMKEATAPSFNTFNGFGTTLLDYRERGNGTWEATRWVVAAMLPLVPLGSYVINPRRQQNSYGRMESYFEVLGRTPLAPARVLRVYALMLLGLAPVVLGFMNSRLIDRTIKDAFGPKYGGVLAMLAMLATVAWGVYIIFFRIKNDSKAYKAKSA
ncbi:MAG TPA: hypothetical protein VN282_19870 [Pyrinomonadaceae bacterium]|nr:hypothetical protein [Pyrinomonadaceae bacterium]